MKQLQMRQQGALLATLLHLLINHPEESIHALAEWMRTR